MTIVALGLGTAGALVTLLLRPSGTTQALFGVLILCLILVPTLTVVGDSTGIEARFGPGLIRKRFNWVDIASATPVRNTWLHGWGIRWLRSGWMFNVSGFDAVELRLKNGRAFRIGTDDPSGLHAFIEKQLGK